jgi:hypothetical protein
MTFSQDIGKGPVHLRWVLLKDLHMSEATKGILENGWPYPKQDFGGGVQAISLLDLQGLTRDMLLAIPGIGAVRAQEIEEATARGAREQFAYRV